MRSAPLPRAMSRAAERLWVGTKPNCLAAPASRQPAMSTAPRRWLVASQALHSTNRLAMGDTRGPRDYQCRSTLAGPPRLRARQRASPRCRWRSAGRRTTRGTGPVSAAGTYNVCTGCTRIAGAAAAPDQGGRFPPEAAARKAEAEIAALIEFVNCDGARTESSLELIRERIDRLVELRAQEHRSPGATPRRAPPTGCRRTLPRRSTRGEGVR